MSRMGRGKGLRIFRFQARDGGERKALALSGLQRELAWFNIRTKGSEPTGLTGVAILGGGSACFLQRKFLMISILTIKSRGFNIQTVRLLNNGSAILRKPARASPEPP